MADAVKKQILLLQEVPGLGPAGSQYKVDPNHPALQEMEPGTYADVQTGQVNGSPMPQMQGGKVVNPEAQGIPGRLANAFLDQGRSVGEALGTLRPGGTPDLPGIAAWSIGGPLTGGLSRVAAPGIRALLDLPFGLGRYAAVRAAAKILPGPVADVLSATLLGGALEPATRALMQQQSPGGPTQDILEGAQHGLARGLIQTPFSTYGRVRNAMKQAKLESMYPEAMGVQRPAAPDAIREAQINMNKAGNEQELLQREATVGMRKDFAQQEAEARPAYIENQAYNLSRQAQNEAKNVTNAIFNLPTRDMADVHELLGRPGGLRAMSLKYAATMEEAASYVPSGVVPRARVTLDGTGYVEPVPVRQLFKDMQQQSERAFSTSGEAAKDAFREYRQMRDQIRRDLSQPGIPPEALSAFDQAQLDYRAAMGLRELWKRAGGQIGDVPKMRDLLLRTQTANAVEKRIGEDAYDRILQAYGLPVPKRGAGGVADVAMGLVRKGAPMEDLAQKISDAYKQLQGPE